MNDLFDANAVVAGDQHHHRQVCPVQIELRVDQINA
jgi:hypothetical protein